MGVSCCARKGCKNIMCDRYSPKYGYICYSCFNELVSSRMPINEFLETEETMHEGTFEYYDNEFHCKR